MYGPPGFAYVYFIYGTHHCLNAVTDPDGIPGAVLIRALIPDEGLDAMRQNRGLSPPRGCARARAGMADGPGKLCQALGITIAENGRDLTEGAQLFIEPGAPAPEEQIVAAPRIGVRGDEETRACGPGASSGQQHPRDSNLRGCVPGQRLASHSCEGAHAFDNPNGGHSATCCTIQATPV